MSCAFVNMSLQGHRCSKFMEEAPCVSPEPHKYEADLIEDVWLSITSQMESNYRLSVEGLPAAQTGATAAEGTPETFLETCRCCCRQEC